MTARLTVEGLRAGYAGVPVVRDLSFTIAAGDIVALLGPNGAGKTTTLHTIAGVLPPLGGRVLLDGVTITGRPAHRVSRAGIACVPQDRGVFHQLTVEENLRLVRPRDSTLSAVDRAVTWFPELKPVLNRRCGLCSGGEQQMLALAKALAAQPTLLLIDELSLGLAPVVVRRLFPVIRAVARETDTAVLLTEQYVPMALAFTDRALVLRKGRLVASGPSADLAKRRDLLEDSYLGAR